MESVAENTGPEAVVRPPARKPGTQPATAEHPLSDGQPAEVESPDEQAPEAKSSNGDSNGGGRTITRGAEAAWKPSQAPTPAAEPDPAPALVPAVPAAAAVAARPAPAAVDEVGRRYRQTIHRVDLWSVLKISVCFYICGMAVTMVALVALWVIADAAGVIHSVEKFFGDLLQTKNFTFLDGEILRGAALVAAVLVVLQIVITVIAAAFYNVFAELFGGVEITISEDESAL